MPFGERIPVALDKSELVRKYDALLRDAAERARLSLIFVFCHLPAPEAPTLAASDNRRRARARKLRTEMQCTLFAGENINGSPPRAGLCHYSSRSHFECVAVRPSLRTA